MKRPRNDMPTCDRATYGRSRAVRLASYDYVGDEIIHLVLSAKTRAFTDATLAQEVCDSVETCSQMLKYELYGYCLMPDHLHVLLSPAGSGAPVRTWLQKFKSYTAHRYTKRGGRPPLWQRSAYDHVCRKAETAEVVIAYIVNNPVRAGLASRWQDWRWKGVFVDI